MKKPPFLVVDADIFIASARSSSGAASQLLDLIPSHNVFVSPHLLDEIADGLMRKRDQFKFSTLSIDFFVNGISSKYMFVDDTQNLMNITRDPKDNYLASLAFENKVNFLVTNNVRHQFRFFAALRMTMAQNDT
jgi:putative PIN family toxin of toxin-antitoxin system